VDTVSHPPIPRDTKQKNEISTIGQSAKLAGESHHKARRGQGRGGRRTFHTTETKIAPSSIGTAADGKNPEYPRFLKNSLRY
jgi:hypothetical protein